MKHTRHESLGKNPASRLVAGAMPVLLAILFAGSFHAQQPPAKGRPDPGLVAHEWGTFTSVAGAKGRAVTWRPLSDRSDLPGFVEHFETAQTKVNLSGTVRMETPVLYFYATHQTKVSVHVEFSRGFMTEWYPRVTNVEPVKLLKTVGAQGREWNGTISWNDLVVDPDAEANFLTEKRASRYYAARQTSASPVLVKSAKGEQRERFLFYRGVSSLDVPFFAQSTEDGRVFVTNQTSEEIPEMVLFERHGQKVGYRVVTAVANSVLMEPPELTSDMASLNQELERTLTEQGLFPDEAQAMVSTWQDSWFEEGTRLLYIAPRTFVTSVLPLTIEPSPREVVRVFVGRLEIVTPATERAVETAFATGDRTTLARYGRFLEPILETMIRRAGDGSASGAARARQLTGYLELASKPSFLEARAQLRP